MRRYGPGSPVWKGLSIGAIFTLVQFGVAYPALVMWLVTSSPDPLGAKDIGPLFVALASVGLCVRFLWGKYHQVKSLPEPQLTGAPASAVFIEPERDVGKIIPTLPPILSVEYCPKGNPINSGIPCHECSHFECRKRAEQAPALPL